MTIEQKAKRYDEAIKWMRRLYPTMTGIDKEDAEHYFPELRESEDERIKNLIYCLIRDRSDNRELLEHNGIMVEKALAWLEKQGEKHLENYGEAEKEKVDFVSDGFIECHADFLDFKEGNTYWLEYIGDDKYNVRSDNLLGKTYHITPYQLYTFFKKLTWLEKQDEPKPADKIEPKFHKGDWIISDTANKDYRICKITDVKDGNYAIESIYGYKGYNQFGVFDNTYRLWDITKDAKDGDLLVCEGSEYLLFKSLSNTDKRIKLYFWYSAQTNNFHGSADVKLNQEVNIYPATKEQRDALTNAMTDAGYTFDFEKKELKKVEQKPTDEEMKELLRTEYEKGRADAIAETQVAWSEEDKRHVGSILERLEGMCKKGATFIVTRFAVNQDIDWLKSLKPQPKQEWSEEDEKKVNNLYVLLDQMVSFNMLGNKEATEFKDWLESLSPQNLWKPSDEQMEALDYYANSLCTYCDRQDDLRSLYNDLKKLKEE